METITVPVDNKNFVGIGKMTFDSNAEWNIPHLHFMVDKTVSGNYEATLLEFSLVSWSESLNDAIKSLVKQTYTHILSVLERTGFEQFIREVDDQVMDGYWRCYRKSFPWPVMAET
jgi:predicted component of type VI protein secretion system